MNADGSDYAEIYAVFLFHDRDLRGADGVEEQFNLTAYYGKCVTCKFKCINFS